MRARVLFKKYKEKVVFLFKKSAVISKPLVLMTIQSTSALMRASEENLLFSRTPSLEVKENFLHIPLQGSNPLNVCSNKGHLHSGLQQYTEVLSVQSSVPMSVQQAKGDHSCLTHYNTVQNCISILFCQLCRLYCIFLIPYDIVVSEGIVRLAVFAKSYLQVSVHRAG